ncbi:cell wall hydrolase [Brevibacillus ginsengisoli]|uniref:cell wall hydrolase n=1 Tax=Brevibacillus ginsengisoli TaxID=363854 RepID=UPI003CF1EA31
MIRQFKALMRFLFCVMFLLCSEFGVLVPPTEAIAPEPIAHNKATISPSTEKEDGPNQQEDVQSQSEQAVPLSKAEQDELARLVYAEGRGERMEGQVAIAAVVLNRMKDPQFPNELHSVIFQKNAFSSVHGGKLTSQSDDNAHKAVAAAISGQDPTRGSLYFFNPKTATSSWIWSRPQTVKIGNHIFAK